MGQYLSNMNLMSINRNMPPNSKEPDTEDDFFKDPLPDEHYVNKRKAVRYVRDDITAVLLIDGLFKTTKLMVRLIDISSKGALIKCNRKLSVRKQVSLRLMFSDRKKFQMQATVVHKRGSDQQLFYGLKFRQINNRLGDYLLATQTDLILK